MRRIRITYDIVSEESVKIGDFEETGWIDEEGIEISPDEYDIEDYETEKNAVVHLAAKVISDRCIVSPSSSEWHEGVWYTEELSLMNEERYSYHLVGFSPEEEQAIYKYLQDCRRGLAKLN